MDNSKDTARVLHKYGAVTVPVFTNTETRQKWEDKVWQALDDMPEYIKSGKTTQRVLGGFGALGNPSSFHHPTMQQLRSMIHKHITNPLFRALADHRHMSHDTRIETLLDRVCVRADGFGVVGGEDWHRDVYDGPKYNLRELPQTLYDGKAPDEIFGGWLNLSDRDTYFVALAGSHVGKKAMEAQKKGGGFATLSKAEVENQNVVDRLKAQANMKIGTMHTDKRGYFIVPPGHMLIFYQRLLHAVMTGKQPQQPQLRIFMGHRLTEETTSLFQNIDEVVTNNGVPHIPSGQLPPMYSQNHYAFFSTTPRFRTWAKDTFDPKCLFERQTPDGRQYFTPGSKGGKNNHANRNRYMPSLSEMGFSCYEYSDKSMSILSPIRLFPTKPLDLNWSGDESASE